MIVEAEFLTHLLTNPILVRLVVRVVVANVPDHHKLAIQITQAEVPPVTITAAAAAAIPIVNIQNVINLVVYRHQRRYQQPIDYPIIQNHHDLMPQNHQQIRVIGNVMVKM